MEPSLNPPRSPFGKGGRQATAPARASPANASRAFRFGRRTERPRLKWIGLAMMLYPYLITDTVGLYVVGGLLAATAWFMRKD